MVLQGVTASLKVGQSSRGVATGRNNVHRWRVGACRPPPNTRRCAASRRFQQLGRRARAEDEGGGPPQRHQVQKHDPQLQGEGAATAEARDWGQHNAWQRERVQLLLLAHAVMVSNTGWQRRTAEVRCCSIPTPCKLACSGTNCWLIHEARGHTRQPRRCTPQKSCRSLSLQAQCNTNC